jgi:hypothetical protein
MTVYCSECKHCDDREPNWEICKLTIHEETFRPVEYYEKREEITITKKERCFWKNMFNNCEDFENKYEVKEEVKTSLWDRFKRWFND